MTKNWEDLSKEEKRVLGYPEGSEQKLKKERDNWDQPKVERHDELVSHKDYSGEQSPYWDWLHENGKTDKEDLRELAKANPDFVDNLGVTPVDYIPEPTDVDGLVAEANRLAPIYLNRRELILWNYARNHPKDSWKKIGNALGITERHVLRVLRDIRNKLAGHF
jgi:hypothetical protein